MSALARRLGLARDRTRPAAFVALARERIVERLAEGVVILDAAGTVADFNPAARTFLDLPEGAGPADAAAALARPELASLVASGEGSREFSIERDGDRKRVEARAFRVVDGVVVLGFAIVLAEVADTAALVEKLAKLASIDPLTGALNRRRFDEVASRDFELARRSRESLGVLMIDLDYFKRVNDEWGHAAGDRVLKVVSDRCRAALRGTDIFARYGGEEFVVLLPSSDVEGALAAAQRLRDAVSGESIAWEGEEIRLTASVGAYAGVPASGEALALFLRRADEALYAAKAKGRDRVALWQPRAAK